MEMTQKQIEIEAQNYLNGLDLPKNADKQLILDNFKNGMSWMLMYVKEEKQQWIDKATQFINNKLQGKHIEWKDEYCWCLECFIAKFKKSMEVE